ncbi:hypothetical protein ACFL2Q_12440 [Thermodesulfobacteriota bacterium]
MAKKSEKKTKGKKSKPKSPPRMSNMHVWLLYAQFVNARNEEDCFDALARTFEKRSDVRYWLGRVGKGELCQLGKGKDFVGYYRKLGAELYRETRGENTRIEILPEP